MFALWMERARPDAGISGAPWYEPREHDACGSRAHARGKIDPRDITCTLIDLAVRGLRQKLRKRSIAAFIFHHKDYTFHLLKPRDNGPPSLLTKVCADECFFIREPLGFPALKTTFTLALPVIR